MRNSIKRDDIIAIINYKNTSLINKEYLEERIITKELTGKIDLNTVVICDKNSYMVKATSKQIMKKLNKSLFLKP